LRIRTKTAAKIIRFALRRRCKTLRVKMARGTAYGWIDIWAGDSFGFTKEEREALDFFGFMYGANCCVISPDSVEYWINKICQLDPETERFAKALLVAEQIGKCPQ